MRAMRSGARHRVPTTSKSPSQRDKAGNHVQRARAFAEPYMLDKQAPNFILSFVDVSAMRLAGG
jgi:hypothetical protein